MKKYIGEGFARTLGRTTDLSLEDIEVVAYGIEYLLSAALGITLALIAAFLLRVLPETGMIIMCWWLVRRSAGGAHCSTIWRCSIGSCLAALATAILSNSVITIIPVTLWIGLTGVWALLAILKWAPNNSKKPVRDPLRHKQLRHRALGTVLLLGLLLLLLSLNESNLLHRIAAAGGGGIASAALMISPPGSQLVHQFDQLCQFFSITSKRR